MIAMDKLVADLPGTSVRMGAFREASRGCEADTESCSQSPADATAVLR